jgi:hypothetical protein
MLEALVNLLIGWIGHKVLEGAYCAVKRVVSKLMHALPIGVYSKKWVTSQLQKASERDELSRKLSETEADLSKTRLALRLVLETSAVQQSEEIPVIEARGEAEKWQS